MGRAGTWGADGVRQRTSDSNWKKPLRWAKLADDGLLPDGRENPDGRRPRIFCASLADVFEPRPELEPWRRDLLDLIASTPSLDWLLLTKRPEEARDWLRSWYESDDANWNGTLLGSREWTSRDGIGWGVLPNIWIGASVENARFTWRADVLREIPASIRFLSCEPLVGSLFDRRGVGEAGVVGAELAERGGGRSPRRNLSLDGIDWVIVGGESGGRESRPMHPTWAREIRDSVLARAREDVFGARPALHMKQWGSWTPDPNGRDANGVWVSPDGRTRTSFAADMYDDLPNFSARMRYAGPAPTSGGKYLDDVDWCEFPRALVLA